MEIPRDEECQVCGRHGAVSYGRAKIPPGKVVEVFKCPRERRYECLELALEKQRIDTKEKREKDYANWRKQDRFPGSK